MSHIKGGVAKPSEEEIDLPEDFKCKLIIEENDTNYGHDKLIWKGNVNFPNAESILTLNKSKGLSKKQEDFIFDKQAEIARAYNKGELMPVENQKDYFELFRYGINSLNHPNDRDTITLSMSLFMPPSLYKSDFSKWCSKYYQNQLKLCVVFNYYFPEGNYRNYFDWYMIEAFKKIKGDDPSLIITKQIESFSYNDFEEDEVHVWKIRDILISFYNELKKYENYNFDNGATRFIFTYDLACKFLHGNAPDLFVYKFKAPFIENIGTDLEGHITHGFIGQLIRYISLKQSDYKYGQDGFIFSAPIIKRPKHIIWRDAHANCIAYNDNLWISKFNDIARYKYDILGLIPSSIAYMQEWNDSNKCLIDGKYYIRSAVAGMVQFANYNKNDPFIFISDIAYLQTIGMAFILNNSKLPLLNHKLLYTDEKSPPTKLHYNYGIDEYVLSSIFKVECIRKNCIYFTHFQVQHIFNSALFLLPEYILLKYYYKKDHINDKTVSRFDFIKYVELLRVNGDKHDKLLKYVLSLYPTKFLYVLCIYSVEYKKREFDFYNKKEILLDYIIDELYKNIDPHIRTQLDDNLLLYTNYKCKLNAMIFSALEWCHIPYWESTFEFKHCSTYDYFSGFYDDEPPSLDIGILRGPNDLSFAIKAMEKNNLKAPLNKSNYKLYVESPILYQELEKSNSFDNIKTGRIKLPLQHLVLYYGPNIETFGGFFKGIFGGGEISGGYPQGIHILDTVKSLSNKVVEVCDPCSALIWKSLNYANYDIPPHWFVYVEFNTDYDYKIFNEKVIELASIEGWPEYALYILLNDKTNFTKADYAYNSDIIKQKAMEYKRNMPFKLKPEYKMREYSK